MERYEKYKPIGLEWIGEIPEHWEVKKLKYIAESNPSNIDKKSKDEEEEIFLCNYVDIYKNEFIKSGMNFMKATASKEQIKKFILQKGDVILTKDSESANDIGIPAFITETFDDVVCGYHLTHIKPVNINGEYLFRQFQCKFQQSYFEISANGVTRYGLGTDKFDSALIIIPPSSEQIHITAYLDRKTAEIDQIIANKQKLIALYEVEKQAVINQAVTRGVNPNVRFKPSGVEWLGDIPEHWEVKRLKYLTQFIKDGTHGSFNRISKGYRLLSVRNIVDNIFKFLDDDSMISEDDFLTITKPFFVQENDIQLAIVGATLGKIGMVPKLEEKFATQRSVATLRTIEGILNCKYLYYFMRSSSFQNFLWLHAGFSAQPGLYLGTLQNSYATISPIYEQHKIIDYIEQEFVRLNTIIEKCKKQIELLKEYRTTLISEVVTGKVKVI